MHIVNTAETPSKFSVGTFGLSMAFETVQNMEPEDFLSLLMRAVVFERRTKEKAYPLIDEDSWASMMLY
jgi:hypothetical protein